MFVGSVKAWEAPQIFSGGGGPARKFYCKCTLKQFLCKDALLKQTSELIFGIFSTVLQFLFSPEDLGGGGRWLGADAWLGSCWRQWVRSVTKEVDDKWSLIDCWSPEIAEAEGTEISSRNLAGYVFFRWSESILRHGDWTRKGLALLSIRNVLATCKRTPHCSAQNYERRSWKLT
jgi:hypothetical protein